MQPDQKIAQLSMRIGELEQHQTALLSARDAVENRPLTGVQVRHSRFGNGEVVRQNVKLFTVAFTAGEKQFLYPDAFQMQHLIAYDQALQADMEKYQLLHDKFAAVQSSIRAAQRRIEKLQRK